MSDYPFSMAQVDDLLSLKHAADGLNDVLDREAGKDAVADAIDEVERAVTSVIHGMEPVGGGSTTGRCRVFSPNIRMLPCQIQSMRSQAVAAGRLMTADVASDAVMNAAAISIYGMVKIILDSTDREDCKLR